MHAIPACAGRNQAWDVFISHRGADRLTKTNIKKTFVSFLHARLQQAGIRSFVDEDSLTPGEQAWGTILLPFDIPQQIAPAVKNALSEHFQTC